jgi:DNA replication and repair protein RecF
MYLTRLSLTNFRNFSRLDIEIPNGPVLLVGNNAQGKTSILEAIYFLATTTSFHADRDQQLINFFTLKNELAVGRIVAEFKKGSRTHKLEIRIIKGSNGSNRTRKEILLDGVKKKSKEILGKFNAALFLPQMMQVVEGSPDSRRRYLNLAINQVIPIYATHLSEYRKVLSQRNALLKTLQERGGDADQLKFWDQRLAKYGAAIIHTRIQVIQEIEAIAAKIHSQLTGGKEIIRFAYAPSFDPHASPKNQPALLDSSINRHQYSQEDIEVGFIETLEQNRREDIQRRVTRKGPHRDEIRFLSNGIDLGTYGSRGQIRTTMMTLKLAEMHWMKERTGYWPVLLLDEVLAELDVQRREDLLSYVAEGTQALLTTTDLHLFDDEITKTWQVWRITEGNIEIEKQNP